MGVTERVDKTERVGYVAGALGAKRNTSLVDCQGWWWVVVSDGASVLALGANAASTRRSAGMRLRGQRSNSFASSPGQSVPNKEGDLFSEILLFTFGFYGAGP